MLGTKDAIYKLGNQGPDHTDTKWLRSVTAKKKKKVLFASVAHVSSLPLYLPSSKRFSTLRELVN